MPLHPGLLPADVDDALLIGRVWDPSVAGPSPVLVRADGVYDLSARWATVRDLTEEQPRGQQIRAAAGERIGAVEELAAASQEPASVAAHLLAPVDLHTLKAAGVTFAVSLIERLIEERAKGDPRSAELIRAELAGLLGEGLRSLRPGTAEAGRAREALEAAGLWSQYLEVGIGPDAEIFTKAPTLAAVGYGAKVGVLRSSAWNNPEPEIVVVANSGGTIVGATLGNDVNLRDVEGRSALLLPRAKDNNASCALGPFLRLFDDTFTIDSVRTAVVSLRIDGTDGFHLDESSDMRLISRDPEELIGQLFGAHHQYPDGAALMTGTMFAPVADRGAPGEGFTHHQGDVVTISTPCLGTLRNTVGYSEDCPAWTFGIAALARNLAARGLLG